LGVLHATCCLAGREEGEAVKEAAMLVGAVVGGHYLGVWTVAVYDEKVCGVWKRYRIEAVIC
jgi:hypothetical protein